MSDRFYLCVELANADQGAPAVREALAPFVCSDEYSLDFEGDKLALEVWTCAQAAQAPLIAAVHDLVRRYAPAEVTVVYIEDDRGSTEQYLGPWRAVRNRLVQEHQARQAALAAAYLRQLHALGAGAQDFAAFAITEGW